MRPSIRCEEPADRSEVAQVLTDAFRRADAPGDDPPEVALVDRLRADASWIAPLSLVAEVGGTIVGYAVCSRASIDGVAVLALGPIAVRTDDQRRGIGTALMNAMIVAAGLHGEGVICLLGDPDFYARFGFAAASSLGITAPDARWGEYFQALVAPDTIAPKGRFVYATPFGIDG